MTHPNQRPTRREFLSTTAAGVVACAAVAGFPTIVPASVLGARAPGNRINIGAIGTGIVAADIVDPRVVFAALTGAIAWNLITWGSAFPRAARMR